MEVCTGMTLLRTIFRGVRVTREDDRGVTEGREDVREVFQQRRSGAKRKLSKCGRNQMGNEPILALPEGADDFVVYYDARSKDLEAGLEKGEGDCLDLAIEEAYRQLYSFHPGGDTMLCGCRIANVGEYEKRYSYVTEIHGKTRMELYMMNRPPGRMILASVEIVPSSGHLITMVVPSTEIFAIVSQHRLAKDLWEKIKCLMKGTSINKQGESVSCTMKCDKFTYRIGESFHEFVNELVGQRLATTNVDQLHCSLGTSSRHANEFG
ncbi:hypothetical protein Tco_0377379 [Tanacetum coccineum]